jgi:transcriptional regulator with XRE-family HTH domain
MKPLIKPEIGRRIRERREQLGWTQQQLSDRLKTSQPRLSLYESGHNLTVATLQHIADTMFIDLSDLIR